MTALLLSLAFALSVPGIMPQQTAIVSAKTTAKAKAKNTTAKKQAGIRLSTKKETIYCHDTGFNESFTLRVIGAKTSVKWKVSNSNVLKLTKKKKDRVTVSSKKAGKATVTARIGKKKLKCKVTVLGQDDIFPEKEEELPEESKYADTRMQIYQAAGITSDMKDQYKCFLLAKWICDNIAYAKGFSGGQLYQEALLEGTDVCAGISDLYRFLLKGQNIPCEYISWEEGDHAWNQVQIDGEWYNVDVTWMGVFSPEQRAFHQMFGNKTYNMQYFLYADNAWGMTRGVDWYCSHHNATSTRFQGCYTVSYERYYNEPLLDNVSSGWCYEYNPWFTGEWVNY